MDHALSPAVADVLDALTRDFADVTISAKDAETLFLGDAAIKVSDLTQNQLLQLAVCQFRDLVGEMERVIEGQRYIIQTRSKPKKLRK